LALRGDSEKTEKKFHPDPHGHAYAKDLVAQINQLNKGIYQDKDINKPEPTSFSVGVAGYPEKHFESPNPQMDLEYLKAKVDAGADYIVTQLFYDNSKYFKFVDDCKKAGINVPIIPGIKPLASLKHIEFIPSTFFIDFPNELMTELKKCTSNDDVKQLGIEWGIHQCNELKKAGVPVIHFYTMGRSESTSEIAKGVF
jgi:methylenetetrahydrofolate reductase (NADPH)